MSDYTYRAGKKVDLRKESDEFIVRALPDDLAKRGFEVVEQTSSASCRVRVKKSEIDNMMSLARQHAVAHHAYSAEETGTAFLITDRIVVRFKSAPIPEQIDEITAKYALENLGALGERDYLFQVTDATGMNPVKLVVELTEKKNKNIEFVDHDLNYEIKINDQAPFGLTDDQYVRQWHLHQLFSDSDYDPRASVNCDKAWSLLGSFGDPSVVVGVTDDGCQLDHPDFNGPDKFADWAYLRGLTLNTSRSHGANPKKMHKTGANHGTSCAGVIAAEADGVLTVGAAPGCRLLPVKWESSGSSLAISDVKLLKVLDFVADKVDILSNSWGSSPTLNFMPAVVDRIEVLSESGGRRGKGILFLWASGNENCPIQHTTQIDTPYGHGFKQDFSGRWYWAGVPTSRVFQRNLDHIDGVMHIAALASTAQRSHYSNYGTGIDACAPSSNSHAYFRMQVRGLGITTATGPSQDDRKADVTHKFGGTSSATPLTAGIAALVISANDTLQAKNVAEILKNTAYKDLNMTAYAKTMPTSYDPDTSWDVSPIPPFDKGDFDQDGWSPWFGFGRVDAEAAVSMALSLRESEGADLQAGDAPDEDLVASDFQISSMALDDGLDAGVQSTAASDMVFPSNGNSMTLTLTLTYSDGRPAAGVPVSARARAHSLTGSGWRTINGLAQRWPTKSGRTLRQRHSQGIIRLGAKLDSSGVNTDAGGKAVFTCQSWHVCGNESQPAQDKITLSYGNNQSAEFIVACGVGGLVVIPSNSSQGLITKPGISGKYLHPTVVQALQAVGSAWKDVQGKPAGMPGHITVTDASLRWGGLTPPHLSHRFGGTVDIRPISTDGNPTRVGAANYSKQGTTILINFLSQTGATEIRFADNITGVTRVDSSHSNHIHASWLTRPAEPWSVAPPETMGKGIKIS